MSKSKKDKLKAKLYKLIDSIEDEELLNKLNEEVVPYVTRSNAKKNEFTDEDLTEEQLEELDQALEEIENGETISWKEFNEMTARWRTK